MIAALLLLTASTAELEWDALRQRIERAPPPVSAFIERRAGCNHFWGEAGSSYPEREARIQATLKELRCDRLQADERALRQRYRRQPKVVRLLIETREIGPW